MNKKADLEIHHARWEKMFDALARFKKTHGHCNVPTDYPHNPSLALWVKTQRAYRKKGLLKQDRLRRLNEIGFKWTLNKTPSWDALFAQLVEFKKRFGHCEVPSGWPENPRLVTWVYNQRRRRYRDNATGKERNRRLDEIGFRWRVPPDWEEWFSELVGFKKAHGHCNVTCGNYPENPGLSAWVIRQRKKRREGRLSKDRIKRLDGLGFKWDKSHLTWEEMFSLLVEYKEAQGNCDVP